METDDPRRALGAKDLPTQTAGARDLALVGTWDDVPRLLELATEHKRVGLRLVAAAAAADILHRYRTGPEPLGKDQVETVLDWVKRTDPGVNPSALMLLSAVPSRTSIDRLGRLLRDPRNDVRTGAAVALRRMASSHTLFGDDAALVYLRRMIGSWLDDRRSPPDAQTALIKLIGNLGFTEHSERIAAFSSTSAPVIEAIEQARTRLQARTEAAGWSGLYVSDGLDVLEQRVEPGQPSTLLTHDGAVALLPAAATDGAVPPGDAPEARRLVWVPRLGQHELVQAIQERGRTWVRLEGKDLVDWMDTEGHVLGPKQRPASGAFLPAVADLEGAVGKRAVAVAQLLAGDLEAADEALTALTGTKKPRADLLFWLGELRAEQGRKADARQAWQGFLERAGKRHALREVAEARLESL